MIKQIEYHFLRSLLIKSFLFLIFVSFIFISPTKALAASTYYVATTGNDSNVGSSGSPWLTLTHAESAASDGDTVNVSAGTYVENDATTHGWSISKAITWVGSGTVTVQANGSGTKVLNISGTGATSISGFTLDGQGTKSYAVYFVAGAQNKTFTNCTLESTVSGNTGGDGSGTESNISFTNSTFTSTTGFNIFFPSGSTPTNYSVTGSTINSGGTGSVLRYAATGGTVTFSNNTVSLTSIATIFNITSSGTFTIQNNTITTNASSYVFNLSSGGTYNILNNTITATATTYIFLLTGSSSKTLTIDSNTFSLNGSASSAVLQTSTGTTGTLNIINNTTTQDSTANGYGYDIELGTWTVTIDHNIITDNDTSQTRSPIKIGDQLTPVVTNNTIDVYSTDGSGLAVIQIQSTGTSMGVVQVKNNTVRTRAPNGYGILVGSDNDAAQASSDDKLDGAIIEGNTVYGYYYYNPSSSTVSQNHGIFYGHNINGQIRYNSLIGSGYGIVLKGNGITYTSGGVYYNKAYNCLGGACIRIKGVQSIPVTNNTFYNDKKLTSQDYVVFLVTVNSSGGNATGTVIKNNIMFDNASGNSALIDVDSSSSTGLSSDTNLFYLPSTANSVGEIQPTTYTFSAWQALGYDTHSKYVNPSLTNASSQDFTLQSGSPAIDAGTATSFTRDFAGTTVP